MSHTTWALALLTKVIAYQMKVIQIVHECLTRETLGTIHQLCFYNSWCCWTGSIKLLYKLRYYSIYHSLDYTQLILNFLNFQILIPSLMISNNYTHIIHLVITLSRYHVLTGNSINEYKDNFTNNLQYTSKISIFF